MEVKIKNAVVELDEANLAELAENMCWDDLFDEHRQGKKEPSKVYACLCKKYNKEFLLSVLQTLMREAIEHKDMSVTVTYQQKGFKKISDEELDNPTLEESPSNAFVDGDNVDLESEHFAVAIEPVTH